MSEQATLTGPTTSAPGVGFGAFVMGLAAAFLAGVLVTWLLSVPFAPTVASPIVGHAGPVTAPVLTDVPTPESLPPLRRAPGAEYRRIPDDGTDSGFVTRAGAVGTAGKRHGAEDARIPQDAGTH